LDLNDPTGFIQGLKNPLSFGFNQWFSSPYRSNQIAVHLPDELQEDLLRTDRFTLAMVRATPYVDLLNSRPVLDEPKNVRATFA
jgi:hypothetical protein